MRYLVVLLLLCGCNQQSPELESKGPFRLLDEDGPYQLHAVSQTVAWRLDTKTGAVHQCVATPQRGICVQFSIEK